MPRKKLSEYRAKSLVNQALGKTYIGWSITDLKDVSRIDGFKTYVVKVDQAIKGRFKKGLVLLDVKRRDLKSAIRQLTDEGYSSVLVESYVQHGDQAERYLFLSHNRAGYHFAYSRQGGVNVEERPESIEQFTLSGNFDWDLLAESTGIAADKLQLLLMMFKENHFVSLEINPYVVDGDDVTVLDTAVEVDDAGQYFTQGWTYSDTRRAKAKLRESEEQVRLLNDNSPASFSLTVLNPNGSIFLLLSGGGASIVIADEAHNSGLGKELANYGEYSGNPNTDETYLYTKQVIRLILDSSAKKKVLFVGGAVANFTDIAKTFAGIIRALDETADSLQKQNLKVYVRRGGPNQEIGLQKIKIALEKYGILGGVYDPGISITEALGFALEGLKK
jgi:ATP-citrate lyase beta-subunit